MKFNGQDRQSSQTQDFTGSQEKPPVVPFSSTTRDIPRNDWRDKYPMPKTNPRYKLENSTDDSELNRMIQLKGIDNINTVTGKPGQLYYDKTNKKVKIFISKTDGWADLDYTL